MRDDPNAIIGCTTPIGSLTGTMSAPSSFTGMIFAGLFPKPIPQGRPVRSTLLLAPGTYRIDDVPDGHYHVLVAGLPFSNDSRSSLFPSAGLLVGKSQNAVFIRTNEINNQVDIQGFTPPPSLRI